MSKTDITALVFAVTQSLLSLVIVIGSGFFLNAHPDSQATAGITGFLGVVITFYFSQAMSHSANVNAAQTQAAITAQNAKKP